MSNDEKAYALSLCNSLRLADFKIDIDLMNRNIKVNFKQADKLNAKFIIIIGEDEMKNRALTIKDNQTKEEFKIDENYIMMFLEEHIDMEG